jgi:ABC-type dipeptide/oligopeptide/nickel transport system ATPase component
MSCSSVVVMAAGRVVERGDPNLLLQNPRSHFASLHSYNTQNITRAVDTLPTVPPPY